MRISDWSSDVCSSDLALDDATRSGREEMNLQTALGVSLMFTRGGMDAARMALDRSLAIAEEHGDARDQLQILGPLHMFHLRTGGFNIALGYARRCSDIAKAQKDSAATILAHALMGMSLPLGGDLRASYEARRVGKEGVSTCRSR